MFKEGTWINGKKTLKGYWKYNWSSDTFTICLDSIDKITGEQRTIITHNDTPEWGKWKLVK